MNFHGTDLRDRRIEMDRSLNDAGMACYVPVKFLEALEQGDLYHLPPRIFALGFLRSYCQYLDLPFEGYLAQLEEGLRAIAIESQSPSAHAADKRVASRFRPPSLPLTISTELKTWLTVCGLLLLGWFTYSTLRNTEPDPAHGHAEAASVEVPRDSHPYDLDELEWD